MIGLLAVASIALASPAAADPLPPQMHTAAGGGSCSTPVPTVIGPGSPSPFASGQPCDGTKATSTFVGSPRSVAALTGGAYLYIDHANDIVREVSGGVVTTVAGNGTTTDAPDGTPAVQSGLDDPVAVSPLPDGGFLITEFAGSVVRIVSPDGAISTIAGTGTPGDNGAGGPATSIELNHPTDAAPMPDGSIVIADTYNNVVRLLSPDQTTISTIAGGGACNDVTSSCDGMAAGAVTLDHPVSVSPLTNGSGAYLIAEYDGQAVREVTGGTPSATFSTVAGTPGDAGYGGDGGPATAALLDYPEQVVSTSGGGFLIADSGNERIRQVSVSGTITTVAGDGVASFAGDGGDATAAALDGPVAVAPYTDGGFLIADSNNDRVRRVTIPPTTTINPGTPGMNGWFTTPPVVKIKSARGTTIHCALDPIQTPTLYDELPASCPYTGIGAAVTGDGVHVLYAAAIDSSGDKEIPVSIAIDIDTTPPVTTCVGDPSFVFGHHGLVTATVSDAISGPQAPVISEPAFTGVELGPQELTLGGTNNAGLSSTANCPYTVVPLTLHPTPTIDAHFVSGRSATVVRRMELLRVPARVVVTVACHGHGCPFARKRRPGPRRTGKRGATIDLSGLFVKQSIRAGDKLTIGVTAPNTVGRVWSFVARRLKQPTHSVGCLAPGSSIPGRGCRA